MGNCLVTKLKGIVDNDNLNKLGVFRFVIKTNNSSIGQLMLNKTNQNTVVKDEKGNILATITDTQGRYNMAANSTFVVEMHDKYAFQNIVISGETAVSEIKADLDELKYSELESAENTGLSGFTHYSGITGHISNFIHLITATTRLDLNASSIEGSLAEIIQLKPNLTEFLCSKETTGNITELSSMVGLTELTLNDKVSYLNSLQQFLDGMAANRTSGTLALIMPSYYAGNNAGITKFNPIITFTNGGWTWA